MSYHGIEFDHEKIAAFCRRHGVVRLSLFGSILRDDFGPESDIDLLVEFARKLGRTDVEIQPDDDFVCDRSLDGSRLTERTGYAPPSWDAMLTELVAEVARR